MSRGDEVSESRANLEKFLELILPQMGLRPLRVNGAVTAIDTDTDGYRVRISLPLQFAAVTFDHATLDSVNDHSLAAAQRPLDDAHRDLFRLVQSHLTQYRNPRDEPSPPCPFCNVITDKGHRHMTPIRERMRNGFVRYGMEDVGSIRYIRTCEAGDCIARAEAAANA